MASYYITHSIIKQFKPIGITILCRYISINRSQNNTRSVNLILIMMMKGKLFKLFI